MTAETTAQAPAKRRRCTVEIPGFGVVDGRTREAWAFRELVEELASDLGGLDHLSRAQLEHCRRAAGLGVLAAKLEGKVVNGAEIDVTELVSVGNAQSRILSRLGLERVARDVTPIHEYIEKHDGTAK